MNEDHSIPVGQYLGLSGWKEMIAHAERRATASWIKTRRQLEMFGAIARNPQYLGAFQEGSMPLIKQNEIHQIMVYGAKVAQHEEAIQGQPLWANDETSISRAYYYGQVFINTLSFFYEMDMLANINNGIEKGGINQNEIINKNFIEGYALDHPDNFSQMIREMKRSWQPVPSYDAIVKTMAETWDDNPKFLHQYPDYDGWDKNLYETLAQILGAEPPKFGTASPERNPDPQ